MKGDFRSTQWDPLLLIIQIIAVQSFLYTTLAGIMAIMDILVTSDHTLDHIFKYEDSIHFSNLNGGLIMCAFILNSFIGSIALWFIVKRTKLCLDFSCTFYGIHLCICYWYNSAFPFNFTWWILQVICLALMCVGGEFLCLKAELKEIPIGYSTLNQKADV